MLPEIFEPGNETTGQRGTKVTTEFLNALLFSLTGASALERFGAVGDGVAYDTDALRAISADPGTALEIRLIPGRTYRIRPNIGETLCTFTGLTGFRLIGAGATIIDDQEYTGLQTSRFMLFSGCQDVYIDPGIRFVSQSRHPTDISQRGLTWLQFIQGCDGIRGGGRFQGGHECFYFQRSSGEPLSYISKNIDLDIIATDAYYPCLFERSGDHNRVKIDATNAGRSLFYFGGGSFSRAWVSSKNCFGFNISSESGGGTVEDVEIDYYNRNSDVFHAVADLGSGFLPFNSCLQFYSAAPATFRNIRLHFDVRNNESGGEFNFAHIFKFLKLDNNQAADTLPRGHVIDGLKITGVMEQPDGYEFIRQTGKFSGAGTTPDKIAGLKFADLRCLGQTLGSSNIYLPDFGTGFSDMAIFESVHVPRGRIVFGNGDGRALFWDCTAYLIGQGPAETWTQTYDHCQILLDNGAQSVINKTFINTLIGARLINSTDTQIGPGSYAIVPGSIANNGTYKLFENEPSPRRGILFISTAAGGFALYQINGTDHTTAEIFDPAGAFSSAADTAGTNIYWSAGDSAYVIQNKTGGNLVYNLNLSVAEKTPPSTLTLTPAPASPQAAGATVIFTAVASGGPGSYEYDFWLKGLDGIYVMVQGVSADDTWSWDTTGLAPGTYYIAVHGRNAGNIDWETEKIVPYVIT